MAKRKVGLAASDISEKWNRRMKQSVPDIQKGINAVTESPMEKAVAKQDKMLANVTQAITSGKWAAQTLKTSVADWKTKTAQKVAERLGGGVDAAMDKRRPFDSYLVSTLNAILPAVADAPDMTIEDSVNRVRMVMMHMHENPYKGR